MTSKTYDFIIVGNGALGNAIALSLSEKGKGQKIAMIGPRERPGCASLAAGAMLNAFAELEYGSLDHETPRKKFDAAVEAANLWPAHLEKINAKSGISPVTIKEGTQLVSNACASDLDDLNFKAIIDYMDEYNEPYSELDPKEIEGIAPEPQARPMRAVLLEREGSVASRHLFNAYDSFFAKTENVDLIDKFVEKINIKGKNKQLITNDGDVYEAPHIILASGVHTQKMIDQVGLTAKIPRLFYGIGTSIILKSNTEIPSKVFRTPNRGLACGIYVVPYEDNYCYVGATNFVCPWPIAEPRITSVHSLLESAMEQVNTSFYKGHIHKIIVGYRPTTLDTFPLIGETSCEGLWITTGTKRDGFHMSPKIGAEIASAIFERTTPLNNIFKPERNLIVTMNKEEAIEKSVLHLLSSGYQHELRLPKSNWNQMLIDALRRSVEEAYDKAGFSDESFGIPPEMIDMYRYGHAKENLENMGVT